MLPTLQILRDSTRPVKADTSLQEKRKRFSACEDKIHAQLGLDFVNEWNDAWDDLYLAELDRAYEEGFLAAWKLWTEMSATMAAHPSLL